MSLRHVAALLLLGACATAEQRGSAQDAWIGCIRGAVARLDDGRTDPVSMAYAISPACAAQYHQLTQVMADQFITGRGRENMRDEMRAGELRMIAGTIVEHRARRR